MPQLVGYRTWEESGESTLVITMHALRGIHDAQQDMEEYILASTYRELSRGDLRFVQARAPIDAV